MRGDYKNAILAARKSLKINPKFAKAYLDLGNSYENIGEYERAEKMYLQALKYVGKDTSNKEVALWNLGNIYKKMGKGELSWKYFRKAYKIRDYLKKIGSWDVEPGNIIWYVAYNNKKEFLKIIDEFKEFSVLERAALQEKYKDVLGAEDNTAGRGEKLNNVYLIYKNLLKNYPFSSNAIIYAYKLGKILASKDGKYIKYQNEENNMTEQPQMSKDEQIGIHKGSLNTLAKEREELARILSIVDSLIQMHMGALKDLGVDLEKMAANSQAPPEKKKPIEDIL